MSERWPVFGSRKPTGETDTSDSSSANGTLPDPSTGLADGSTEDVPDMTNASGDETQLDAAEVELDPPVAIASDDTVTSPAEPAEPTDLAESANDEATEPTASDVGTPFRDGLVRAMRAAVAVERERIGEDAERRLRERVDEVRAREASEAERMRELADEDMAAIEAWAEEEMRRIQVERERRVAELNQDLETSLIGHRANIEQEIAGIERTIANYRAELDTFFDGLERETDPVRIAQQASNRPEFPGLEQVPEEPTATEPDVVGVMDAEALAARIGSWSPPPPASPEPAAIEDSGSEESSRAGALLGSVPIVRPMSFLRQHVTSGNDGSSDTRD